jgi:hypothetical protein
MQDYISPVSFLFVVCIVKIKGKYNLESAGIRGMIENTSQDRQCTCNVTYRRVRVTAVAAQRQ